MQKLHFIACRHSSPKCKCNPILFFRTLHALLHASTCLVWFGCGVFARVSWAWNDALFSCFTAFQPSCPSIRTISGYCTHCSDTSLHNRKCTKCGEMRIQKQLKMHLGTRCVGCGGGVLVIGARGACVCACVGWKGWQNIFHMEYFDSRSFFFSFVFTRRKDTGRATGVRMRTRPPFKRQSGSAVIQKLLMTSGCACARGSPHVCLPALHNITGKVAASPPSIPREGFNVSFLLD